MIAQSMVGGELYTAIVGPHPSHGVPSGTIRVSGRGIRDFAEYADSAPGIIHGAERRGHDAIRYTIDNIVLPHLFELCPETT